MRIDGGSAHAVDEETDDSQSFARRRYRPSHANVRSTTPRRGRISKPLAASDRLMISMVQSPRQAIASRSLCPA